MLALSSSQFDPQRTSTLRATTRDQTFVPNRFDWSATNQNAAS